MIGVAEAHDGKALPSGRVVAKGVDCDSFQDAQQFFAAGGERGRRSRSFRRETIRINPVLFDVVLAEVVDIPENKIGIVTAKEGKALPTGEIAGGEVPDRNMFQDPDSIHRQWRIQGTSRASSIGWTLLPESSIRNG